MSEVKQIVVVGSDEDNQAGLSNHLSFIGCQVHRAKSKSSLESIQLSPEAVTAVILDFDLAVANQLELDIIPEDSGWKCPVYVLEKPGASPANGEFNARITGTLPSKPNYQDLLAMLHEAELLAEAGNASQKKHSRLISSLVGRSPAINKIRQLITQVAPTDASVLILGESGTGKEVVARNIHQLSSRSAKPFVPVNCGAIPADLLESELFGHEKGAFTGAISARQGRFEMAEGGTLFLDEIGDMPMNMQVKLLRVLQERAFERVGSDKTTRTDVRILAATHQNLEQQVAEGKFRMDLYYRLNVFPIEVPALRDRPEDIPLLVKTFTHQLESRQQPAARLNSDVLAALGVYSWPGNVRELSNLVERLAILSPNKVVKWSDLPDRFRPNQDWIAEENEEFLEQPAPLDTNTTATPDLPAAGIDLKEHLAGIESGFMQQALEQSDWVVARAAKLLKLQRTTLVEKMRKFDIKRPDNLSGF